MSASSKRVVCLAVSIVVAVAACSVSPVTYQPLPGDGSDAGSGVDPRPEPTTVQVTVTGLVGGGLVVTNNGGDDLAISREGRATFATPVARGASYAVEVKVQPSQPSQICSVSGGAGTAAQDVVDVAITCSTSAFTVGGMVTGVTGRGLVLQDNNGDDLAISGDGSFTFATPVASGAPFAVTIAHQPSGPTQTCTVSGGTGTIGNDRVASVVINCAIDRFIIGGSITGVLGTLVVQNNAGDQISLSAEGTFAFPASIASDDDYHVTVVSQPDAPVQACTIENGDGKVGGADVNNIVITCTTTLFHIGGTLSGLADGDTVVLNNNVSDSRTLTANGIFMFDIALRSDAAYSVQVTSRPTDPISQNCTVTAGAGIVGPGDVTTVKVVCTTKSFRINGMIAGLNGGTLRLLVNGGSALALTNNGAFSFPGNFLSGTQFTVTIESQPLRQNCQLTNATGIIGDTDIGGVRLACSAVPWSTGIFPIGIPNTSVGLGDFDLDQRGDLLVTVNGSAQDAIIRVNHATGATSNAAVFPGGGVFLLGVAYRPANDMIYTVDSNGKVWAVTQGGQETVLTNIGSPNGIAIAPASFGRFGGFVLVTSISGTLVAVDPATGATSTVASTGVTGIDLVFAPDGTLYMCGGTTVNIVKPDGTVTPFATGFGSADGITITPDGSRMFIADSDTDSITQITLPGGVRSTFGPADIDDGPGVGGILAAPGNTLIVMTGETALNLRAFAY